jgi:hypothetical protein
VVPVNVSGSGDAYNYHAVFSPTGTHPIVEGISSFSTGTYTQYPNGSPQLDVGATLLGTADGQPAAAAAEVGGGRTVYLGPIYAGYYFGWGTAALRSGDADRLLEQAVAWAASGRDSYTFAASANDALVIETTTPGDLPGEPDVGEPDASFNPAVVLFAPNGQEIPSSAYTETSPDGRNVRIEFTPAAPE